mmetsp:Transcript_37141/g.87822  ORF Transcript_37141/g.87822 Transcript_37141/m.87822 type:complete len:259 (+) Transcript_37141:760-1536(+)
MYSAEPRSRLMLMRRPSGFSNERFTTVPWGPAMRSARSDDGAPFAMSSESTCERRSPASICPQCSAACPGLRRLTVCEPSVRSRSTSPTPTFCTWICWGSLMAGGIGCAPPDTGRLADSLTGAGAVRSGARCGSSWYCCCCCCCCAPNFSARYWGEPRRRRALKSVGSRSGLWKPSSTVDPCAPRIISVTARPSTDTPSTVRRMSPMRTSPERSADCPGAIRRTACSPSGLCRSTSPTPACSSCKGGGGGMSFSNPPC